jgi:hypothetical protein
METAKLRKMMKTIDDALTAVSFAEEGAVDAARSVMTDGRRVLLGLKAGRIDGKTLKYALNAAKRINARLDILYVSATNSSEVEIDHQIRNFETELASEGIRYRLIFRAGCLKQQIINYTNSEKEVLFAVIESPTSLDADCNKGDTALSDLWQKLKCPLVVVMDGAGA